MKIVYVLLVVAFATASATTIHVPADQPTIQAGIDAAGNGDTVLVDAGTYLENLNFHGKLITVASLGNRQGTIIDGGQKDSVVTFNSGETRQAILKGFTITHGLAGSGGGVNIAASSPSIVGNFITQNSACSEGGGIFVIAGAPLIIGNTISKNFQQGCVGGQGGGITVENGAAGLQIIGNQILNNTWNSGDGGGMIIRAFGSTLIQNNLIKANISAGVAPASHGGGLHLQASANNVVVLQNVIVDNQADQGAGLYLAISGGTNPVVVNNTIANNQSTQQGSAIYITGITSDGRLVNNLFIGRPVQNAVFCDPTFTATPPLLRNNDAFSFAGGTDYEGNCAGKTGQNGNISVDPIFSGLLIDDFHLRPISPVIDVGANSAPRLPPTDFEGHTRIFDGNGDGTARVDMGAYEFSPPN